MEGVVILLKHNIYMSEMPRQNLLGLTICIFFKNEEQVFFGGGHQWERGGIRKG
jgi:hypothetical protein